MSTDEEKIGIIEEEKLRAKAIQTNLYKNLYQMEGIVPLETLYEMSIKDLNMMIQAMEDQQQLNALRNK